MDLEEHLFSLQCLVCDKNTFHSHPEDYLPVWHCPSCNIDHSWDLDHGESFLYLRKMDVKRPLTIWDWMYNTDPNADSFNTTTFTHYDENICFKYNEYKNIKDILKRFEGLKILI